MKLAIIGDVALNGLFVEDSEKNKDRFSVVSENLKDIDFVVANLETPVISNMINSYKVNKNGIILSTTEDVLKEVLPLINIKHLSLANNHSLDYSDEGLDNTIKVLEELGITYSGVDKPYTIIDFENLRIAFISSVCLSTNPHFPIGNTRINIYNLKRIIENIVYIKDNNLAERIIVSIHWGVDYSHYPTENQIIEARRLIDVGADIIWGHHSHVMQPFEEYKNGLIFYSLGQLCFGDYINCYGNLSSMRYKSKLSMIPVINLKLNKYFKTINSKELKGNFIKESNIFYDEWNKRKWLMTNYKNNFKILDFYYSLYKKYFERLSVFLFGYYRSPFKFLIYRELLIFIKRKIF